MVKYEAFTDTGVSVLGFSAFRTLSAKCLYSLTPDKDKADYSKLKVELGERVQLVKCLLRT